MRESLPLDGDALLQDFQFWIDRRTRSFADSSLPGIEPSGMTGLLRRGHCWTTSFRISILAYVARPITAISHDNKNLFLISA